MRICHTRYIHRLPSPPKHPAPRPAPKKSTPCPIVTVCVQPLWSIRYRFILPYMNNIYYTENHIVVETPTTSWAIRDGSFDRNFPHLIVDDLKSLPDEWFEENMGSHGNVFTFFEID